MLAGLKLFKWKKSYYEITLGADVQGCSLKQVFWKISRKLQQTTAPESFFNKAAGPQQIFTGDCFSNLLELSMVFGPVKKSSENVHISLKTKSKHQVTYLKIQIISKSWTSSHLLENYRSSRGRCSVKKGILKNFKNLTGKHLLTCNF